MSTTRNGRIAHLPQHVRHQLNRRWQDDIQRSVDAGLRQAESRGAFCNRCIRGRYR
ncbi:MAG: hypothetical protein HZA90_20055 [Verrucomicrobia bacterium]|nr:hypothetical protein [Verrucomicrobiota bacterium]